MDDAVIGASLIEEERLRQIYEEGWTSDHDALHMKGELIRAAKCYLEGSAPGATPADWPFESEAWNPSDDPIRNLVKAGALIAAEIDRLQRLWRPA